MRRAVGPILTTGVALAASAIVVANPIVSTRADVQIPAVALSAGTDDVASMLDQTFLDAIAPAPPKSTNPLAVLKDLITSLAADATDLGKNAIVGAFVAGVTAVSEPELTASSAPYLVPDSLFGGESPAAIVSVLPGLDVPAVSAAMAALPPAPDLSPLAGALSSFPAPSELAADFAPAVTSLVTDFVDDVEYVGKELVFAAFAAGAVVAAQPGLIADTVMALAKGDFKAALNKAITVVTAPLGPTAMVVNALRTVLENRLADLSGAVPEAPAPGSTATVDDGPGVPDVVAPVRVPRTASPVTSVTTTDRGPDRGPDTGPAGEPDTVPADLSAATSRSEAKDDDTVAAPVRRAVGKTREVAGAAADDVPAAVTGAAAAVGGAGDRAERAGRGASPTGDTE